MRIRIVTFHRALNCGAALQAYALSQYLSNCGHEVEVLDYIPKWMREATSPVHKHMRPKEVLLLPHRSLLYQRFYSFVNKNIPLTKTIFNTSDIVSLQDCDMYITGSDQVWNPEITKGLDLLYTLDFETNAKKMSYAASYGMNDMTDEVIAQLLPKLSDYCAVSVREYPLATAISNAGFKNVETVLDPVFLLNRFEWERVSKPAELKNYVLIYTKAAITKEREIAHQLATRYGLKVIDTSKIIKQQYVDRTMPNIGPREFLGLIKNARFVVTNSFHGTALSIVFRKNFYSLTAGKHSVRIESILNEFGLQERLIDDLPSKEQDMVNYQACERIIQERITASKSFLAKHCNK